MTRGRAAARTHGRMVPADERGPQMRRWRPRAVSGIVGRVRAPRRMPFLQVVKTSVAAVLAWVVADLTIAEQPPIFAAIAALLVVQPSVNQSIARALERSFGVVVGVIVASLIAFAAGSAAWLILLAVVVALVLAWALRLSPGTSNQVPISAMLVLALGAATPVYAIDRVLETVIGALVALVVNLLIVPPVLVAPARREVAELAEQVAAAMERLAVAVSTETDRGAIDGLLIEVRLLRPMLERSTAAVAAARESLTLNPRGARHRDEVDRLDGATATLEIVTRRVMGMTRAVRDHIDPTLHREPIMARIATELRRAAHDVRMRFVESSAPGVDTDPLLTTPLIVLAPHPQHWVLIGALLQDLRRVHEEVAGE